MKCQPVPELSSVNMYIKATMALMMALDKAEKQNRLDSPDQAVDSLWYRSGLSINSLHSQLCSWMIVGLKLR